MKKSNIVLVLASIGTFFFTSCGGGGETEATTESAEAPAQIFTPKAEANPNGIGPVAELTLEAFNPELAAEGEEIFTQMCTACHKLDKKHVGPALGDVLDRRNPAWVMNMILNPDEMVKEDPVAKALFAEFLSPMANQNLTEDQARAVVEYIRQYQQNN